MRTATCRLVWLLIAGLSLHTTSDARVLGAALTGAELLVELDRRVPGEKPPGIYSITPGGELERVIAYGRSPVWSPDHTKFVCLYGGRAHLADLEERKWQPIDHVGEWAASAPSRGPDTFFCWTPDGTRVVSWSLRPRSMPPGPPGEAFWAAEPEGAEGDLATVLISPEFVIDPMGAWRPPLGPGRDTGLSVPVCSYSAHIGQMSFAPDGSAVAYETYDLVAGFARANPQVHTFSYETGTARELQLVGLTHSMALNPLWSPAGDKIAVDFVASNSTVRRTAVVSLDSMDAQELASCRPWLRYTEGIEWAPDGSRLLLKEARDASGLHDPQVSIRAIEGEGQRVIRVGPTCRSARWSPDGSRIAVLSASGPDLRSAQFAQIAVYTVRPDTLSEDMRLSFDSGLMPMAIDW